MRFQNIQIVRLTAAVGVAVIHLAYYAEELFGATGWTRLRLTWLAPAIAPLFFAMSGFVLAHVLQSSTPGRFVLHRALRLYPGYWLAIGIVFGLTAWGLWPGPYLHGLRPAPTLESMLAVPPTVFPYAQYPLLVEWTLIYEVALWAGLVALWQCAGMRRLPWAVAAWLLVLAVKAVVRPDYGSRMFPTWKSLWVSVFVAPFLLGVLAYYLRTRGRRWRWAVLAGVVGLHGVAAAWVPLWDCLDAHYGLRSLAGGLTLWFLVQIPDASPRNPLAVAGGYSYGLYLLHVPLMLFGFGVLRATSLVGTPVGVVAVGLFTLTGGLLFGRLEVGMHDWLRRRLDGRRSRPVTLPMPSRLTVPSRRQAA